MYLAIKTWRSKNFDGEKKNFRELKFMKWWMCRESVLGDRDSTSKSDATNIRKASYPRNEIIVKKFHPVQKNDVKYRLEANDGRSWNDRKWKPKKTIWINVSLTRSFGHWEILFYRKWKEPLGMMIDIK